MNSQLYQIVLVREQTFQALNCGTSGFSKEIKLKKLLAKVRIARPLSAHLSHCIVTMFLGTTPPSNLAYFFLPPTRKGMWPTPYPPPKGNICSQPTSKCIRGPHSSPTNEEVYPKVLPQPISRSTGVYQDHSSYSFVSGL